MPVCTQSRSRTKLTRAQGVGCQAPTRHSSPRDKRAASLFSVQVADLPQVAAEKRAWLPARFLLESRGCNGQPSPSLSAPHGGISAPAHDSVPPNAELTAKLFPPHFPSFLKYKVLLLL